MATYTAGELVWKITGDNSGLDRELKKTDTAVKKTGESVDKTTKKVSGMSTSLKVGLAAAAAFAAVKLKQFFSKAIDDASEAAETAQKFGNVYVNIKDQAIAAAKEMANTANVSLTESKAMLATAGNVLTGVGFTQDAALSMSETMVQTAADLKSFNNLTESTEMVTQRLIKALLGERESLIGLDIKLSEKDLIGFAEASGLAWKSLTRQQKAELTLNAIRERSKNAIGDVNKSIGTYAHTTRALANRQKDLSEAVGAEMLPALTELKKAFLDSSSDGGFLYNALLLIGKALGKAIQGVTVLVQGLNTISSAISEDVVNIEAFNTAAGETGNKAKAVKLLAGTYGNVALAVKLLKQEAESGDKESEKFLKALEKRGAESQKAANKTENAYNSLKTAAGKFNGTLEETAKKGVKGFSNVGTGANDAASKIKKISKETLAAKKFIESLAEYDEVGEITKQQEEKLTTVNKYREKGLISEKQAADAIVKINENASKKIRDLYIQRGLDTVNTLASGVQSLLGAISNFYQASADAAGERLELEREQALEVAGVAEETAVEKAERELEIAKKSGKDEEIQEKKTQLTRAKINEDFDKRKAELDYNASLRGWELQLAMAKIQFLTAPLNAYVSSLSAPWPLNMILAPINAALALATAGYSYAAIQEARPTKPKFAEGGIVPGSASGTPIIAGENNQTELVSNPDQMANILNAIGNGAGGGSTIMIHNTIELEGTKLCDFITEASRDGRTKTNSNSIVNY